MKLLPKSYIKATIKPTSMNCTQSFVLRSIRQGHLKDQFPLLLAEKSDVLFRSTNQPTFLIPFCPFLPDQPSIPKIGRPLWMFPNSNLNLWKIHSVNLNYFEIDLIFLASVMQKKRQFGGKVEWCTSYLPMGGKDQIIVPIPYCLQRKSECTYILTSYVHI